MSTPMPDALSEAERPLPDGFIWMASTHPYTANMSMVMCGVDVAERHRELLAEVTRLRAAAEAETADTARLDWLESKTVEVRDTARYGSFHRFWASPEVDEFAEPSDIRAKIDAARAPHSPAAGASET